MSFQFESLPETPKGAAVALKPDTLGKKRFLDRLDKEVAIFACFVYCSYFFSSHVSD